MRTDNVCSRGSENRTYQYPGVQDALVRIVLHCLRTINRNAQPPQPFSGYWFDAKLCKPNMEIQVLLFDPLLQEVHVGALDADDAGQEIWVDQYGRELEGITMWAELPYPECNMALSKLQGDEARTRP